MFMILLRRKKIHKLFLFEKSEIKINILYLYFSLKCTGNCITGFRETILFSFSMALKHFWHTPVLPPDSTSSVVIGVFFPLLTFFFIKIVLGYFFATVNKRVYKGKPTWNAYVPQTICFSWCENITRLGSYLGNINMSAKNHE